MKLTPKQRQEVLDHVDDIFMNLKARLLGRFFKGPRIYFEVAHRANPLDTIEGIFQFTHKMLAGPKTEVDENHVEALAETTGNYIDSKRLSVANKIMASVAQADTPKEAMAAINEHVDKASDYIDGLVANETRTSQAYAERSGITQVAASIGVEDPNVCKIGVIDGETCENCIKLWHDEDNLNIPKVYKLSELKEGYMDDHKNPFPTVGPTHPRCRHVLTMVPPNFGFDKSGTMVFKSLGHDEYEHQQAKGK